VNLQKKNPRIVLEAVKQNIRVLAYVDEYLRRNPNFMLEAVKQNGRALNYADESLRRNPIFMLEAVSQNGLALEYADVSLRKNPEIALAAVKENGRAIFYADVTFQTNIELLNDIATENPYFALCSRPISPYQYQMSERWGPILCRVHPSTPQLDELLKTILKTDGLALRYVSYRLKGNR